MVTMKQFCIDLPSIFQSDINYKHMFSELYTSRHRLVQFNCLSLSGMKYDNYHDESPLFASIDHLIVQYHPAMTEIVAPCVCMLSALKFLISNFFSTSFPFLTYSFFFFFAVSQDGSWCIYIRFPLYMIYPFLIMPNMCITVIYRLSIAIALEHNAR